MDANNDPIVENIHLANIANDIIDENIRIKRLQVDKFLKKKTGLYTSMKICDPFLKSLLDENYPFTKSDYDKLLDQLTYKLKKGFLNYYETWQNFSAQAENFRIYNLVFKNIKPTDAQIERICSCFNHYYNDTNFKWVNILLENKYKFTENQLKSLTSIGYNIKKIFAVQNLTASEMKAYIDNTFTDKNCPYGTMEQCFTKFTETFIKFDNLSIDILYHLVTVLQTKKIKCLDKDLNAIFLKFKVDDGFFDFIIKNNIIHQTICKVAMGAIPMNLKFLNYCSTQSDLIFHVMDCIKNKLVKPDISTLHNFINLKNLPKFDFPINQNDPPECHSDMVYKAYKFIIFFGVEPTMDTLYIACSKGNVNIFNDLTINKKLMPNETCRYIWFN